MRTILVWVILVCGCGGASTFAQTPDAQPPSPDVQQLQQKVQQLEQLTQDLKARLAELEKSQTGKPQVVNTNIVKPAESGAQPASADANKAPAEPPAEKIEVSTKPAPNSPAAPVPADEDKSRPRLDVYGFAMLDMGYDVNQNDPQWFDVMRPTKLPSSPDQFGHDGNFYSGVRQTRFGVKGYFQTPVGELKTIFEWELFGVGVDAGQTTFRLRHAWGELGQIGAGQSWSPYMDPDVFPNSLEYWGPNGMVFFRNVQVRWMPINKGNHQLWFALERPGASGDLGTVANRIELQHIQARFPAPDISARFRWGGQRGYLQISGIGRYIAWDDLAPVAPFNFSGHTWGWGVNVSSNVPVGAKDVLKLAIKYGHGDENYMNDAPIDVAPIATPTNLVRPIDGEPLPNLGIVAFFDHYWSEKWSTSLGYSELKIDNTPLELASDFHRGQYALINLLSYPAKNVMIGGEFQWGKRNNFADGFEVNDYRMQFGFRYNFDFKYGGEK
ncbi:MAG TPA: DcaP family trimeric outer membrane transporter [Candidatus Angelobacter sp.]|jgi:hypothetical protein